jgi:hypothetical protein
MANATGTAAAHTPSAGEGWIFKGGVTVDYHAWPANVPWGGTASNPTYIGVDPGWYSGSAWSRPIFSGGGPNGYDSTNQSLLTDVSHHTNYFVIDNIEFTALYWSATGAGNTTQNAFGYLASYSLIGDVGWEAKNLYVHGWSHASSGAFDPAGYQSLIGLPVDATVGNQSSFHDSVVDGSDGPKDCCMASDAAIQYNNYVSYVVDGYNGGLTSNGLILYHDNHLTKQVNSATGVHENCFHVFAYNGTATGGAVIAYNNFDDCKYIGTNSEPLAFELIGSTVYAFNNFISAGNSAGISNSSWSSTSAGSIIYDFNNTIQAYDATQTPGSTCYTTGYHNKATFADNFCVTTNNNANSYATFSGFAGTSNFPSPSFSITCSGETQSTFGASQICAAIGTGNGTGNLNFTQTYPFVPLDSTAAAAVGTGQNNSSYCQAVSAINTAAGSACLKDTTLGVAYNSTDHTVSWPLRTPTLHSSTGAWQNGAYEFTNEQQLNPPTGLAAVVN